MLSSISGAAEVSHFGYRAFWTIRGQLFERKKFSSTSSTAYRKRRGKFVGQGTDLLVFHSPHLCLVRAAAANAAKKGRGSANTHTHTHTQTHTLTHTYTQKHTHIHIHTHIHTQKHTHTHTHIHTHTTTINGDERAFISIWDVEGTNACGPPHHRIVNVRYKL